MKKLLSFAIVVLLSTSALAQQPDLRRKITVSGSADSEVTPDIIYLSISLKEYLKDNNSKKKINITELENQLYTAVLKAGITKENLMINDISSYNYAFEKKKNPDFLASKQYRLKVDDLSKWNSIVSEIDPKGLVYTNIDSYEYSKIEELKKELKIKALKAAKEKAMYMVEALGEKLGSVIDVQEVNNEYYPQPMYKTLMAVQADGNRENDTPPDIEFKKIKLSYVVNTVFEIK
jgi:uncharacterized protein YggE